jgi:hypothetical protein
MSRLNKIAWTQVEESSNVKELFFDEHSHTICVRFANGYLYSYAGATEEIYMGLVHAPSMGSYIHHVVKAFPVTRWDSDHDLLDHLNA